MIQSLHRNRNSKDDVFNLKPVWPLIPRSSNSTPVQHHFTQAHMVPFLHQTCLANDSPEICSTQLQEYVFHSQRRIWSWIMGTGQNPLVPFLIWIREEKTASTEIPFNFSGSRKKQVLAGSPHLRVSLGSLAVFLWNLYKSNFSYGSIWFFSTCTVYCDFNFIIIF